MAYKDQVWGLLHIPVTGGYGKTSLTTTNMKFNIPVDVNLQGVVNDWDGEVGEFTFRVSIDGENTWAESDGSETDPLPKTGNKQGLYVTILSCIIFPEPPDQVKIDYGLEFSQGDIPKDV